MQKTDVKKLFGSSVKAWRNQMGLSQEQLAERADLHRTYVSDVERGARNLSLESITRLANALTISVATLFPQELTEEILIKPTTRVTGYSWKFYWSRTVPMMWI